MKSTDLKMQYRINDRIRAKEVRLVGDDLEQGVYKKL
jgi:translation initiation factor IF-3